LTQKLKLRAHYLTLRNNLSASRRAEAATTLFTRLSPLKGPILSFSSFGSEIDTAQINLHFAAQGQLHLPKRSGQTLAIYRVTDLDKQLHTTSFGLREPIPELCEQIDPATLQYALIPALAFDSSGYRLGYGKGYYDRFLTPSISTIGIGFQEQSYLGQLPIDPWDFAIEDLFLV
jgi:5-formyltetrahydrofolate cyclo-ligase